MCVICKLFINSQMSPGVRCFILVKFICISLCFAIRLALLAGGLPNMGVLLGRGCSIEVVFTRMN